MSEVVWSTPEMIVGTFHDASKGECVQVSTFGAVQLTLRQFREMVQAVEASAQPNRGVSQ